MTYMAMHLPSTYVVLRGNYIAVEAEKQFLDYVNRGKHVRNDQIRVKATENQPDKYSFQNW